MAATVAGLIAYAAARGTILADDPATAAALVRAQDYILYNYLQFGACTVESPNVAEATYEAAMIEAATPGFWSGTYTPAQQKTLTGVGSIRWTPTGDVDGSGVGSYIPRSTKIDMMMRECGGLSGLNQGSCGPVVV